MVAPSHETGWAIRQPQTPHGLDQRRNKMQPWSDSARRNERKVSMPNKNSKPWSVSRKTANACRMIRQPCLDACRDGSVDRGGLKCGAILSSVAVVQVVVACHACMHASNCYSRTMALPAIFLALPWPLSRHRYPTPRMRLPASPVVGQRCRSNKRWAGDFRFDRLRD